jgi:hypothetical protein
LTTRGIQQVEVRSLGLGREVLVFIDKANPATSVGTYASRAWGQPGPMGGSGAAPGLGRHDGARASGATQAPGGGRVLEWAVGGRPQASAAPSLLQIGKGSSGLSRARAGPGSSWPSRPSWPSRRHRAGQVVTVPRRRHRRRRIANRELNDVVCGSGSPALPGSASGGVGDVQVHAKLHGSSPLVQS